MGAARDIAISVTGAAVVGLAVYAVDRYLATKQAASTATQTPDLGANGFVAATELAAQFTGNNANANLAGTPGNIATPPPGSTTTITTSSTGNVTSITAPTPTTSNTPTAPTKTAAQILIAQQSAELAQLQSNAGNVGYNKPVTNVVQ